MTLQSLHLIPIRAFGTGGVIHRLREWEQTFYDYILDGPLSPSLDIILRIGYGLDYKILRSESLP